MKLSISNATRFKKMPRNQILALMLQTPNVQMLDNHSEQETKIFGVALFTTKLGAAF